MYNQFTFIEISYGLDLVGYAVSMLPSDNFIEQLRQYYIKMKVPQSLKIVKIEDMVEKKPIWIHNGIGGIEKHGYTIYDIETLKRELLTIGLAGL